MVCLLVKVVAKFEQEIMVALTCLAVADRICPICGQFRHWLIDHPGGKVSARMLSGYPVSGDRKLAVYRLLNAELSARPHRVRRKHILARDIAASRQSGLVDRFAHRQIRICTDIVCTVSHRNIEISPGDQCRTLFLVLVKLPLNGRHKRGRIASRLNIARDIKSVACDSNDGCLV